MYRKVLILAGALVLGLAAPAAAQYEVEPTISVPQVPVTAGGTVSVSGSGFAANTQVTIFLLRAGETGQGVPVGTVTTDVNGNFTTMVRLPAGLVAGTFSLMAVGGGTTDTTTLQVAGAGTVGGGSPTTVISGGGGGVGGAGVGATPSVNNSGSGSGGSGSGSSGSGSSDGGSSYSDSGSRGTSTSGGSLARTGTDSIVPLTAIGAALVAAGGGAILFTRSRRQHGATGA